MGSRIGILIFDGAEEMDFVGPWEVLSAAAEDMPDCHVVTIAATRDLVTCEKGMRVLPDSAYPDEAALDILVVPGGSGARREIGNTATTEWLNRIAPGCSWITSVCTGTFLLVGSGLAQGKRVTTHHRFIRQLEDMGGSHVVEDVRFIQDGRIVTAAGVMSGIEMSLWLTQQIYGSEVADRVKDYIAYDFPPRSLEASS